MYGYPSRCAILLIVLYHGRQSTSQDVPKVETYGPQNPASMQLEMFAKNNPVIREYNRADGIPIADPLFTRRVGADGPIPMDDINLIEVIQHFNHERIPERVVHAKGTGANGYFLSTYNMSEYTQAVVFNPGQTTRLVARFSSALRSKGHMDTVREMLGFAIKMYTPQGNWDLLTSDNQVFFNRDAMRAFSLVHSRRNNPRTGLRDPTAFWDYLSLLPETLSAIIFSYAAEVPLSYANIQTHSINSFALTKPDGSYTLVKYHLVPNDGVKGMSAEDAANIGGKDPDYLIKNLYNKIAKGEFPSWNLTADLLTHENIKKVGWDRVFDPTKIWPAGLVKTVTLGQVVLDSNPFNFFDEIEQAAFCPSRLIPGMEPSLDPILMARLLAYQDAQNYRLGINHQLLPVNQPFVYVNNIERDGRGRSSWNPLGDAPNYIPTSFNGPRGNPKYRRIPYPLKGMVNTFNSTFMDDFASASSIWSTLTEAQKSTLSRNIAGELSLTPKFIRDRAVGNFFRVTPDWGNRVTTFLTALGS